MFGRLCLSLGLCSALLACGEGEPARAVPDGGTSHSHEGDAGHHHGPLLGPDVAPLEAGVPGDAAVSDGFAWNLPYAAFPRPRVPSDNPMSAEKVELGRHLFYDKRLSGNETFSCASCHQQERAFAEPRAVSLGSTGQSHSRSSMSLANVAYAQSLTWSNPNQRELELQLHVPLFGDRPVELGMASIAALEERLRGVARYRELFQAAYPQQVEPITMLNVARALASFQRTLISGRSPFDRYYYGGDEQALSESQKRGLQLVTVEGDHRFECNHCHGQLPFFSDHVTWEGRSDFGAPLPYHQTGLYDVDGQGSYPAPNLGALEITGNPDDRGKFKAPTLRNVALTAPYMHDGSIATLSEVIDHYAQGGRHRNRGQTDPLLRPVTISEQEKADILAFLESLTDQEFIAEPKLKSPWPSDDPVNGSAPSP